VRAGREVVVLRRIVTLLLCFLLLSVGEAEAAGGKIPLLDGDGLEMGFVKVNLAKGSVKGKATLAPLPADIDTGTEQFEATIYMAYLTNSLDPAVEVPLGPVYPSSKSAVKLKTAFKGDLSGLALDRVVVVAFSKDGLHSFDVLTGTIPPP